MLRAEGTGQLSFYKASRQDDHHLLHVFHHVRTAAKKLLAELPNLAKYLVTDRPRIFVSVEDVFVRQVKMTVSAILQLELCRQYLCSPTFFYYLHPPASNSIGI